MVSGGIFKLCKKKRGAYVIYAEDYVKGNGDIETSYYTSPIVKGELGGCKSNSLSEFARLIAHQSTLGRTHYKNKKDFEVYHEKDKAENRFPVSIIRTIKRGLNARELEDLLKELTGFVGIYDKK